MQKIVINRCYGGFCLSDKAIEKLVEWGASPVGQKIENERDHPLLVRVVAELGADASGIVSALRIVEIPDGVVWEICDYDGLEWVAEVHRTWF